MKPISSADLLQIWERGQNKLPLYRALDLLQAGFPERSEADLAALLVGERNALLLELREAAFGPRLAAVTSCPGCGQRLELDLRTEDLRTAGVKNTLESWAEAGGRRARFRAPTSADLIALADVGEPGEARLRLLDRCVIEVQPEPRDPLPVELSEAVFAGMAALDPRAQLSFQVVCPACGRSWQAPFDILSYLWSELNAWALRLLHDVHLLASAYHWSETEILAMGSQRRQAYLEMIGA